MEERERFISDRAAVMAELMRLPRAEAHRRLYYYCTGRKLDLDNPQDYNEKLQWLMVNRYDKNVSCFADKLAVRDYVRSCGLEGLLPEIYGVYLRAEDIDFADIPQKVIIKANHGSGNGFYEIPDGRESGRQSIDKLNNALKLNYWQAALEYHYRYIMRYLFAEELIEEDGHERPDDYKVYCFSGCPMYIKVITGRGCGVRQSYYDTEWNYMEMVRDQYRCDERTDRPVHLAEMLKAASILSAPFPTARVDFYDTGVRLYFGELTLTPAAGLNRTDKPEMLMLLGRLTDLSYFRPELLEFKRSAEQGKLTAVSLFRRLLRTERTGGGQEEGQDPAGAIRLESLNAGQLQAVMKDACSILGGSAPDAHKNVCLDILYRIAFIETMSLEECWQIYWNLNRSMFLNHNLRLSCGSLRLLYRHIFNFVHSMADYSGKRERPVPERARRIVVVTSQFLKPGHAPTTRVLDYSLALRRMGYDIFIINDSGMNYYKYPYLAGVADFNFREEYNEYNEYEYRGERFGFFQLGVLMPDINAIQLLLDNIYEMNPMLVFNIGASCLTADLCSDFVTTASLPCSFAIPVSECPNLLLGRSLEKQDKHDAAELETLNGSQRVIETCFNYVYHRGSKEYSRSDFGIPESAFMATVVGNRLGSEITGGFLEMLDRTLAELRRLGRDARLVFIGEIGCTQDIIEAFDEAVRPWLVFTGGLEGAAGLIALGDLNINPDRSGGGRAAFEAMYSGVPVLSLRKGDAYCCGGPLFGADSYEDYSQKIIMYCTDRAFYGKMSEQARLRAAQLEDIQGTLRRVLDDISDVR